MVEFKLNKNNIGSLSKGHFKKNSFEVNPLDVNIAKIQYNLISRLEREVPDNRNFAPVVEEYFSNDPTLDLSSLKVVCKHIQDNAPKADTRCLEVSCSNKSRAISETRQLCKGKKQEILSYIQQPDFFETCKHFAKNIK